MEFKFNWNKGKGVMIQWLSDHGFDTSDITVKTKSQRMLDIVRKQAEANPEALDYDLARKTLLNILTDFEMESCKDAQPYSGSIPLLETLRMNDVKIGLVTNNGRDPVTLALDITGMNSYLSSIVTRDDVEIMKPDPQGVLKVIEELGSLPEETVFIGDSVEDIQAAKRAGVTSIAIYRDEQYRVALSNESPNYMISDIDQAKRIILSGIQ